MEKEHGVRYLKFKGRDGYLVSEEKFFNTPEKLQKFVEKLENDPNFYEVVAYTF